VLQESAVQLSASSQSAATRQQPAMALLEHVLSAALQTSVVQALSSSQSIGVAQQPGTGVLTQAPGDPPERSHVSVVQEFPSLHWLVRVQVVAAWRSAATGVFRDASSELQPDSARARKNATPKLGLSDIVSSG